VPVCCLYMEYLRKGNIYLLFDTII
jgi:hypothetical protein